VEGLAALVENPIYHPQWTLPPWLGKVKWIRRAGPEAVREFCVDLCGLPEVPESTIRNESSSPGWVGAPLSLTTRNLVEAHPGVKAWDGFLANL
jgi:hypothetical protein